MTRRAKIRVNDGARDEARPSRLSVIEVERRPALATIVADRIRDAIVFGALGLGEAVSEERLASMLGVSRTPVREALTHLQLQGLIDIRPQRGSFVYQPTKSDIEELCQFRAMIEIGALRLAYQHDRVSMIKDLRSAQDVLAAAEAADDWPAAARADAAFHTALFRNSGNKVLVQAYDLISGRIGAARFFTRRSDVSRRRTGIEHKAIIRALSRGDIDDAEKILTDHIVAMPGRFAEAQKAIGHTEEAS
jgi:DNA-binding GntR family transcriptional regulator